MTINEFYWLTMRELSIVIRAHYEVWHDDWMKAALIYNLLYNINSKKGRTKTLLAQFPMLKTQEDKDAEHNYRAAHRTTEEEREIILAMFDKATPLDSNTSVINLING